MCLYPRLTKNRKYTENKKNGGVIPPVTDIRVLYTPRGCGDCMECRKQKGRNWQIRLLEDIKKNTNGKFITLTFSNESIKKLNEEIPQYRPDKKTGEAIPIEGYERDNAIAILAMRKFNERWRKKRKNNPKGLALRHWTITELGHQGTENIHIHGIVWTNESYKTIREKWAYGFIWPSEKTEKMTYVSARTVNYIIKYVTKMDEKHKGYKPVILTSPGIGGNYLDGEDWKKNKFNETGTKETYRTSTGHKIAMPTYWRNKIYNDEEREKLWLQRLDKQERWVMGEKINVSKNMEDYFETIKWYRRINKQLGFGNGQTTWEKAEYEKQQRILMLGRRIQGTKTE